MIVRIRPLGLAAISNPHPMQYDSISLMQCGLFFRIDTKLPEAIFIWMQFLGGETLNPFPTLLELAASEFTKWGVVETRAKQSDLFLVKSASSSMRRRRPSFRTDEVVPQSGIYRVIHRKHRLPHEVTLLRDQQFPRCSKCQNAVVFELIQAAKMETEVMTDQSVRIYLYELPVFEEEQPVAV